MVERGSRTVEPRRVHDAGVAGQEPDMEYKDLMALRNRRRFLGEVGCGIGTIALAQLLEQEGRGAAPDADPLAPKKPHFAPKAKNVIFMFMEGAPSQMDLFDPKPGLEK